MKKILVTSLVIIGTAFAAQSQVNAHAIGLRGGSGNHGAGGEITYQHGMGDANRLELDLGWRGNNGNGSSHMALSGIYHWVMNIDGGFNWFIGPGAQIGTYSDKDGGNDGLTLGLGGQIGIEYDFNELGAPILLGLDTRPMFGFIGGNNGFGYGGAFSIKFTF